MCILMVEDEPLILAVMAETLVDAGYEVRTAGDGPAAMAMLREPGCQFSALVSDYHLPGGITGLEIAAAIRSLFPGLPVILATGRPDVLDAKWRGVEGFRLLHKPYGPSDILTALGSMVPLA